MFADWQQPRPPICAISSMRSRRFPTTLSALELKIYTTRPEVDGTFVPAEPCSRVSVHRGCPRGTADEILSLPSSVSEHPAGSDSG
jgi:hypothetical protein